MLCILNGNLYYLQFISKQFILFIKIKQYTKCINLSIVLECTLQVKRCNNISKKRKQIFVNFLYFIELL